MTWPQQNNPSSNRNKAKAPYNFVPLPEKVLWTPKDPPTMDRYHSDLYTGWLDCTLTTSSPLYVRCGLTLEEARKGTEAKDCSDFFYVDPESREPVIPGSSLRGMLRTLVEIVSYSKVQPVTNDQLVYRAVADTSSLGEGYREKLMKQIRSQTYEYRMKAGYIRQHGRQWSITPAKPINGAAFARIEHNDIPGGLSGWHSSRNASTIFVDVDPIDDHRHNRGRVSLRYPKVASASGKPGAGLREAVVVRTGRIPRKHLEFVFGLPYSGRSIPISDKVIATYRDQITDEQQKWLGKTGALQDWQPVFYLQKGSDVFFFGHAMMFRLPYEHTPYDLVPRQLRNTEQTDLAEALFGYVEENAKERSVNLAGRVSVTAATLKSNQGSVWFSDEAIVPQILASPKPTTFQHYLVQREASKKQLRHYNSQTPKEAVIRGHKLYWHKGKVSREEFEKPNHVDPGTQHTEIRPVKSGVQFGFKIYFENLSPEELGAVLWILNLAQDEGYRLKLGMGKPLGLGAVKIESELRLTNREGEKGRYTQLFDGDKWDQGLRGDNETKKRADKAIKAFEDWILPGGKESLEELERIQMLLALLSWPGPSPEETRYLEIEHPQYGNEYRDRPVLPDSLSVASITPDPTTQPSRGEQKKPASDRKTGRVKWFNEGKGYGFIDVDGESKDVFVHYSAIEGSGFCTLYENQRVEFSVVQGDKGPRAEEVRVIQ